MRGMDASTGGRIDGLEHLRQSLGDILATPRGSRIMRRNYGSDLYEHVDRPMNDSLIADIQGAVALAVGSLEPRLHLQRIVVVPADPDEAGLGLSAGRVAIRLEGFYMPEQRNVVLDQIPLMPGPLASHDTRLHPPTTSGSPVD